MGHSTKCPDLTTHWNRETQQCQPCIFRAGHQVNPNCGFDDNGGRHELVHSKCRNDTFNDGSWAYCQKCSVCPPGYITANPCNSTTDTRCQEINHTTGVPVTIQPIQMSAVPWAVPLVIIISIMLVVLTACIIYMKRNKGQQKVMTYNRQSSFDNTGFAPVCRNDKEDTLSPQILSAPLQTVLDNLDVLEELVILLDPDSNLVKGTKHLASHCSFSSNWITYTYSMKDSKSPLKAVLEGVTSRHPDWTVGHLVNLLRQMERNDAIAVLAKLRLHDMAV